MDNETSWFNQVLMTHKDIDFNTDGYLRIAISTGSYDFTTFNPINFGITISNQITKVYNLNIQHATDLLSSVRNVINQPEKVFLENNYQILKRFNKRSDLLFEFITDTNRRENIVRITILSNESDFTKIIIPYNLFQVFSFRLKYYVENYDHLCIMLPGLFLQKELLNKGTSILTQITKLPSNLLNIPNDDEIKNIDDTVKENVIISEHTIKDLDSFLGGNEMSNIEDTPVTNNNKQKSIQEYDSEFVKRMENKLDNFENILMAAEGNNNPIQFLIEKLLSDKKLYDSDDFNFTPNISEDDWKSIVYLSKLNCNINFRNSIENGISIPSSLALFKYKINEDMSRENIELSFDLLVINGFVRTLRKKLEDKVDDPIINKSILYLLLRSYTDLFTFSFLERIDNHNIIKSNIISRFKYYNKIGFFETYQKLLTTYNCSEIIENDIGVFIDEVIEKIIGKSPFVDELHNKLYEQGSVLLKSKNTITSEQIINELLPYEINEKLGLTNHNELSEEIKKVIYEKKLKSNKTKETKKQTTLYKLIYQYRNEIPSDNRDDFLQKIENYGNESIDMNQMSFPLETLGDNIIKILYIWKPEEDPKIISNFKYLYEKFENEIMTKNLIMAQLKAHDQVEDESSGWDFAMVDMN